MNTSHLMLMAVENERLQAAERRSLRQPPGPGREHSPSGLRPALRRRAARTFTRQAVTGAAAQARL